MKARATLRVLRPSVVMFSSDYFAAFCFAALASAMPYKWLMLRTKIMPSEVRVVSTHQNEEAAEHPLIAVERLSVHFAKRRTITDLLMLKSAPAVRAVDGVELAIAKGETLGLVVNASRANRVDVAPVIFRLRMNQWVAVNFRSRCENELRALGLRQPHSVVRAQRPDLQRLNRQLKVINGAGRACEMEHPVETAPHMDMIADVMMDEFKIRI